MLRKTAAYAGILACWAGLADAQEGAQDSLRFSQEVIGEAGDLNTGEAENAYLRTNLDYVFTQVRRTSDFQFDIGASLDIANDSNDREFDIRDPRIGLAYSRESAATDFSALARFQRQRVRDSRPDPNFDNTALIFDRGDRDTTTADLRWRTSQAVPIGFNVGAAYRREEYRNTTDPDLFDNDTLTADGEVSFRITDTSTLLALASVVERRFDDTIPREEEIVDAGFGYRQEINGFLLLTAELVYVDRLREDIINDTIIIPTSNSGLAGGIALTRSDELGRWRARFDSDLLLDGRRRTLALGRETLLPFGSVGFELGLSESDNTDPKPTFELDYTRETATARFTARASQRFTEDNDNRETSVSFINLGYLSQINSVSSWDIGLGGGRTEELTGFRRETTERLIFDIGYRRQLTRDWDWRAAYEQNVFLRSLTEDENTRKVTLGIERSWRGLR